VLVDVKNDTAQRYVPAAIEPPVVLVENPVAVDVENDCEFNNAGGAAVTVSVQLCDSPPTGCCANVTMLKANNKLIKPNKRFIRKLLLWLKPLRFCVA
jgi:hypothetical protein